MGQTPGRRVRWCEDRQRREVWVESGPSWQRPQMHLTHSPSWVGLPPWHTAPTGFGTRGQGRAAVGHISRPCDRHSVVENCRTFRVGPPCLYLRNWGGIELGWPWLTEGTSFLPGKCSLVLNHLPLCLRQGSVSQATWGRERAAGDKDGQCHVL